MVKGLEVDAYCPMCGEAYENETMIHLLDCAMAWDVWLKYLLLLDVSSRGVYDFAGWCHTLLVELDEEVRGLFMNLLWVYGVLGIDGSFKTKGQMCSS